MANQRYLESLDKNLVRVGLLVSAYDVQRKRKINSDDEITFTVPMTSEDYQEKLELKGHIQDERGQYYVIESRSRIRDGLKLLCSFYCRHIFHKLADFKFPYGSYIREGFGVHISELTNRITAATGGRFTFSIDDSFDLMDVKDFGAGHCRDALESIINLYRCEMKPDNFVIHLKKKIGTDKGMQYRLKKNIVSDQFKDNTTAITTRLFAQMKDGMTWIGQPATILTNEERALLEAVPGAIVNGILQVNYLISPFVHHWSSDSVPFFDGEIIEQDIDPSNDLAKAVADLLEVARKTLRIKEIPDFEISVDGADLFKIDNEEPAPDLGDTVYCYDPKMEMNNMVARIMDLTEYPYTKEKHAQVMISNVAIKDFTDIIANLGNSVKTVEKIFSGGRIRAGAFEEFAKQAVHDINNSKTELKYPEEGGILAQDKNDPLRQVRLTAAGLGISTDGWATIRAAITADGILGERIIGKIGNFESLSAGSGNDIVILNYKGLAAGNAEFDAALFRVDMKGNVVARSIKLTGEVENSEVISSTIRASHIIGGDITADTDINVTRDARVGNNLYMGLAGAVNDRRMEFVDPGIYEAFLSFAGSGTKEFKMRGANDVRIDAGLNAVVKGAFDVILQPGFYAYVGSSSPGNRIVTASELDAIWAAIAGKADISHSHSVTIPNHNHGNPDNLNSGGGTYGVS
jgi:hypothetical protein